MNCKVIACDLDGTLLRSDMSLSAENLEAIEKLKDRGVHFVPSTGRAFGEIPEIIRECPHIRYYLTSNGAAVYDKLTDKTTAFGIENGKINEIMDILAHYRTYMTFHADKASNVDADKDIDVYAKICHMNSVWPRFVRECNTPKRDFEKYVRSTAVAEMFCIFFDSLENLERGRAEAEALGGLRISSSAEYNIELFSDRCGKGKTLHCLCDMLGVPYEASLAVGDSLNDITMLKAAGLGLAVSNALEPVKNVADRIICSNEEHVARFILENII